MSDIKSVTQKINEALWEVKKLELGLMNLVESIQEKAVEEPQPGTENTTVPQPADDTTQKVPVVQPPSQQQGGGNFSA